MDYIVDRFKDNMLLANGPDHQISFDSDIARLTIPYVFPQDSGRYVSCFHVTKYLPLNYKKLSQQFHCQPKTRLYELSTWYPVNFPHVKTKRALIAIFLNV